MLGIESILSLKTPVRTEGLIPRIDFRIQCRCVHVFGICILYEGIMPCHFPMRITVPLITIGGIQN